MQSLLGKESTRPDIDRQKMSSMKQMKMRMTVDNGVYPGLKKFKVHGKELRELPRSLFGLLDLEYLDLSPERETCLFYQLTDLPREICQLPLLKVLVLDTNQLRKLPEEICTLQHLELLTLSNNQLSTLPHNFHRLHNLRSLHCSNNRFTQIPEQVVPLQELSFLDFSTNLLTSLPENIGEMSSLVSLILNYNQIESLPASIGQLQSLQILWLSGNNLRSLPTTLSNLTSLDWTHWCVSSALDGNPLQIPPLNVAKKGPEAIDRYFKSQRGNARNCRQMD